MPDDIQQQLDNLRATIRAHDRAYYVEAAPTISDLEYDRLLHQLKTLEAAHPDLITPDSPTQRVGGEVIEGFRAVEHAQPMYSIENTYNADDLRTWAQRCFEALDPGIQELKSQINQLKAKSDETKGDRGKEASALRNQIKAELKVLSIDLASLLANGTEKGFPLPGGYFAEPKIDGVAISLRYEQGRFSQALTRGDGVRGDDVTNNVNTIRDVPKELSGNDVQIPAILEVRGEIFMPNEEFNRLNELAVAEGDEPFANPRNFAAGTLKQLDSRKVAARRLCFIAHGRGEIQGNQFSDHTSFLDALQRWGIPVSALHKKSSTLLEVLAFIEDFDSRRQSLDYGVDGVVVRVNDFDAQEQLGFTSRFPRWCVAYKYASEQATTKLLKIDWQVGKTGKLTPRATMEPVFVAGTTVQHATLHNMGEIRRKGIRIGDVVVIEKAGEIIPQVVRVALEQRSTTTQPVDPPEVCPECGGDVEIDFDDSGKETGRFCINPECPAQFRERLIHFVGRNQMRIDGLGEEVIDQLLAKGLLHHLADLYDLSEASLAELTHTAVMRGKETIVRLGEKNAAQIVKSLNESKQRGLARVLASLGIRHIGLQTAKVIASNVSGIDELLEGDEEQIRSAVFEKTGNAKYQKVKEAAEAFHAALHSQEGRQRIAQSRGDVERRPNVNEVQLFLDGLPDGGKKWRIKWGSGGGKKDRILSEFATLDELCAASADEFVELFDDEVVGRSLLDFVKSKSGSETIRLLKSHAVDMTSGKKADQLGEGPLKGKTFVVTGTLNRYKREEIHGLIESLGGHASGSVSSKTDYLVAGENAGSKLEKAQSLGVAIIDENEFSALIESLPQP